MLSLKDNPPLLSASAASPAELQGTWWIAHTKARFEKAFAWDLIDLNIGYFLPMIERERIVSGKRRRGVYPLFSSYVFVCGDEESRSNAFRTGRIASAIPVRDQKLLISQLESLHRALIGDAQLELYSSLAVGTRCKITSGPMAGLEGVIIERGGTARIVLEISVLGQGAAFPVDADLLEKLEH